MALVRRIEFHLPPNPTEQDGKDLLQEYQKHCQGWGSTRTQSTDAVTHVCLDCGKNAHLGFTISSVIARLELRKADCDRQLATDKKYQQGEWERLDGRPFLKASPVPKRHW